MLNPPPQTSPSFWLPAADTPCWGSRLWLYRPGMAAAAAYCWMPEYAWLRASMEVPEPLDRPPELRLPFRAARPAAQTQQ